MIALAALLAAALAGQGLEERLTATASPVGVTWVGYRVPMISTSRRLCCDGCRLETGAAAAAPTRVVLEPPHELLVLARFENRAITRIRTFTPDCDIDASGTTLVWLAGVTPPDSVAWLSSVISSASAPADARNRILGPALSALAFQAGDPAAQALIGFARTSPNSRVRGQALFWTAQRAGEQALATIGSAIDNDPETDVKKRAVFALSQLPADEGIPKLIEVARSHRNVEVRKQAFFWLGQSKDPRALAFLEEILLRP